MMKKLLCILLLTALPLSAWSYGKGPDSGLIFNEAKLTLAEPTDGSVYHGSKSVLLVHPDDLPERNHYSNSNMARVELHVLSNGGGARAHTVEGFREQAFIVLEGAVNFTVAGEVLKAQKHDVVFVPPGLLRQYAAAVDGNAKVLQVDWFQAGSLPAPAGKGLITGERFRPMVATGGEGYVSVTPSARQVGIPLSIVSYGAGHIRSTNALLLYQADLPAPRPFTANTMIARMGLSAYGPDGGTRWHFHADREQCFVILEGKGLFEIGANTIEVGPGDILFAPRHVGHGYKTTGDKPFKFIEVEWGRD